MTLSLVVIMSPYQYEHHIGCLLVSVATIKQTSQYIYIYIYIYIIRPHPLAHIVYNRCKIYSNISNTGHDILMDSILKTLQQYVSIILSYNEKVWFKKIPLLQSCELHVLLIYEGNYPYHRNTHITNSEHNNIKIRGEGYL